MTDLPEPSTEVLDLSEPLSLDSLQKEAYRTAASSGWHETPRDPLVVAALIHTEISEFVEEARKAGLDRFEGEKPVGPGTELADAVIRIADAAEEFGYDLEGLVKQKMLFNRVRPYRHGGKLA